jgi:hypothetical protein
VKTATIHRRSARNNRKARPGNSGRSGRRLSTAMLRSTAIHGLRVLPLNKLKVAAEFIVFLEYGASDEATAELLRIPGFLDDIRLARREFAAGKGVDWRKVRRDV